MLRYYLKAPILKKILQFQEERHKEKHKETQKHKETTNLQQVTGGKISNLVLKRMPELFLKDIDPWRYKVLSFFAH